MIDIASERRAVLREAESWIGTPFHHAQCVKGAGVDCVQFLIATYQAAGVVGQVTPERYSPDWFLHQSRELLLEVLEQHCTPVSRPQHGDLATYRFGRTVAHLALVVDWPTVLHADRTTGAVTYVESGPNSALGSRFAEWWTLKRWAEESHV